MWLGRCGALARADKLPNFAGVGSGYESPEVVLAGGRSSRKCSLKRCSRRLGKADSSETFPGWYDHAPPDQGCCRAAGGLVATAGLCSTGKQLMLPMVFGPYCTYPLAVGGECCAVNGT